MELLLGIILVFCILNLLFLVAIGAFLVRFRDRINNIFSDLIQAMEVMWGSMPVTPTQTEAQAERPKTWDEKYEKELESMSRRLREEESGLKDLERQGLSWGAPPALNPQNAEGLNIKDR